MILSDTDHFDPRSRTQAWVWKTFLRGHNPILMDDPRNSDSTREAARTAMGHTLTFANRLDLASMVPREDLASSGYCLANNGIAYRLYGGFTGFLGLTFTGDLSAASGRLAVERCDPSTGATIAAGTVEGEERLTFRVPFLGDAVLYIFESTGPSASGPAGARFPATSVR